MDFEDQNTEQQPNEVPTEVRSPRTNPLVVMLVILIVVLLIAIGVVVLGPKLQQMQENKNETVSDPSDTTVSLTDGFVYFNDNADESKRSMIFEYEIAAEKKTAVVDDPERYVTTPIAHGGTLKYISAPFDPEAPYDFPYSEYMKITDASVGDADGLLFSDIDISLLRDVSQSTESGVYVAGGASQLVTDAEKEGVPADYRLTSNFSVYLEEAGNLHEKFSGVSPEWSPNGSYIYYLTSEGMYSYDLARSEAVPAIILGAPEISRDASFAFTGDRTHVVITSPRNHALHVYEVRDEEPLWLRSVGEVITPSNSPAYDLFTLGEEDVIGYVWYSETGDATITAYDTSSEIFKDLVSVPVSGAFSLEPLWSASELKP